MGKFHCIKCHSDNVIYLGKAKKTLGSNVSILEILGPYQYKCKNCGSRLWSSNKEKTKHKWYKEKK